MWIRAKVVRVRAEVVSVRAKVVRVNYRYYCED